MTRYLCLTLLLSSLTTTTYAQQPGITYERLLVPVVIPTPISGAYGSMWSTTLVVRNNTDARIFAYPFSVSCNIDPCPPAGTIEARETIDATGSVASPQRPAALLFVDRNHVDDLSFTLRVKDVSRTNETWGTAVPVVREREFRNTITITDIPADPKYRVGLRVYDPDARAGGEVRVRLFRTDPAPYPGKTDQLLGEKVYRLTMPYPGHEWHTPSYLEVGTMLDIAPVASNDRLTVEITATAADMRIWALAAVTHVETQFATIVLPR